MAGKIISFGYDNRRGMMVDRHDDGVVVERGAGRTDLERQARARGAAVGRAKPVYAALLAAETSSSTPSDMRRVLSAERQTLHVAMESGDVERIDTAVAEGARVARMWGVEI